MRKTINGLMLGLILFLLAYCVCFWFGIMPKFYPVQGVVGVSDPVKHAIAVKFVGSAVVGVLAGLVGFLVGRQLPERTAPALHLVAWAVMIAACTYLVGREADEYIYKFLG